MKQAIGIAIAGLIYLIFMGIGGVAFCLGKLLTIGKKRKQRAGAAVQNNDPLGSVTYSGFDGTSYINGATITANANQAFSVGANMLA
jgi:hypothetical protein